MAGSTAALIVGFTIQGLAVARALANRGVKVYVIERSNKGTTAKSAVVHFFVREGMQPKELTATLLELRSCMPEERIVLFPGSDRTVRAVARNWDVLGEHYLLSWSPHVDFVPRLTYKTAALDIARSSGTRFPATCDIKSATDIETLGTLRYPVIVKPDRPPGQFKTFLAANHGELRRFVEGRLEQLPLVAQEYIEGSDEKLVFCTLFLDQGKEVASMTGRKLRSFPAGRGRGTVIETNEDPKVLKAARRYFTGQVLSGPVSIEFKLDADGEPWLIEPNVGRTEYCVDAIIQSGLNLPYMEFCYALGEPFAQLAHEARSPVIWYDTQSDPLCYALICLKYGALNPFGKRSVFPFLGHGNPALIFHAGWTLLTKRVSDVRDALLRRLRRLPGAAALLGNP